MNAAPTREEFRQFMRLAVRWGDVDMLGHVNNAKFFTYDESARLRYFEALAEADPRFLKDYGPILARISSDFIAQLHYPAEIDIGTRIEKIGRSSLTTRAGIFLGDKLIATVSAVVVWFDYTAQQSIAIPDSVRDWIRQREAVAPIE